MPRFSIIIPNWNGQKFLKTCLDSLQAQSFSDFEIILVDNGSTDDSIKYVAKNYPKIKIIALPKNIGFAGGVNTGIKVAQGKIITLLNNDTELDVDWLKEIDSAATEQPEAGFFATKMLDFKHRDIIDSCGNGLAWSGRSYAIGRNQKNDQKWSKTRFVFGACGGAAAYRRELFNKVGLFDETFFSYLEDVDLDFRAQLQGFKCLFVPEAKVYHLGSATYGRHSPGTFCLVTKNRWHFIYKNFPLSKIILNFHKILTSEIRFFLASLKHKFPRAYFSGILAAIREHLEMVAKRREIQKSKKVDVKYLEEIIK